MKEGLRRQDFSLHAVRKWRELCAWISQSSEEERRGVTSLPRWGSCSFFCGLARVFILPVCARLARGCWRMLVSLDYMNGFVLFCSDLFLCVWVFWLHVCIPCACLMSSEDTVSNWSIPRNWSWKQLWNTVWVLELSSGPLEEPNELLAMEPSLHPLCEVLPLHHRCHQYTCVNKPCGWNERRWFHSCLQGPGASIPIDSTPVRNSDWSSLICIRMQIQ